MTRTPRGTSKKKADQKQPKSTALTALGATPPIPQTADVALSAACMVVDYSKTLWTGAAEVSLSDTADALDSTLRAVRSGKLGEVEDLLMSQAVALNAIFVDLSSRAVRSEHLDKFERFLRLGLKAQGQCRATLETLAAIKNPPLVVTRQANITSGPQQVNNGVAAHQGAALDGLPRAGKSDPVQNELLEASDVEWLDTRATSSAARSDSGLAPMGGIHGSTNSRG